MYYYIYSICISIEDANLFDWILINISSYSILGHDWLARCVYRNSWLWILTWSNLISLTARYVEDLPVEEEAQHLSIFLAYLYLFSWSMHLKLHLGLEPFYEMLTAHHLPDWIVFLSLQLSFDIVWNFDRACCRMLWDHLRKPEDWEIVIDAFAVRLDISTCSSH